jgi:hypothetical protein
MDMSTSFILYAVLQVCAFIGIITRALPGKEQQNDTYQAKGNLLPILSMSFAGYLIFLFG